MLPGLWREAASPPARNRSRPRCRRDDADWFWSCRLPRDLLIREATIRDHEPHVCWVADRRADPAGVPSFSDEMDTTTTQGAPIARLRDRPRGHAEARSAPDACAPAGLARAAGRSRATPSNASLAKVRADRERLSPTLTAPLTRG